MHDLIPDTTFTIFTYWYLSSCEVQVLQARHYHCCPGRLIVNTKYTQVCINEQTELRSTSNGIYCFCGISQIFKPLFHLSSLQDVSATNGVSSNQMMQFQSIQCNGYVNFDENGQVVWCKCNKSHIQVFLFKYCHR